MVSICFGKICVREGANGALRRIVVDEDIRGVEYAFLHLSPLHGTVEFVPSLRHLAERWATVDVQCQMGGYGFHAQGDAYL